jgi:hypothetical protein
MSRVEIQQIKRFLSFIFSFAIILKRNSKPLLPSEGYWAEPWALTEVPLCAVIDPAKDFRWHALRCDVENAGFICEMEGMLRIVKQTKKSIFSLENFPI